MKTKIENKKAFNVAIDSIVATGKELRETGQQTVLFGFEWALAHGDVEYLNRAFKACINEAKLDTAQMLGYIKAHINVELKDPKKPRLGFKKTAGKPIKYKVPMVKWFKFEKKSGTSDALTDQLKSLETFIANTTKKVNDHKFKDNQEALEIVTMLKAVQARIESGRKPELQVAA